MHAFPPSRIMVAYDFSEQSIRAWKYARDLASRFGCKLDAVHVSPFPIVIEASVPAAPLSPADLARLRKELSGVCEDADGCHVREGDVPSGIIEAARSSGAGLIIMGTTGVKGVRRIVRPSRTEEVARLSPIPVLAVHGDTRLPRSVLAPVNLEPYSLRALAFAERAAAALGARVTLFHVASDAAGVAAARRDLGLVVGKRVSPVIVEVKVAGGRAVPRIVEEAARHELVVLAVHRKGILRDAVLGTTAEQVLRRSSTPVLCVPASLEPRRTRRRAQRPRRKLQRGRRSERRGAATGA